MNGVFFIGCEVCFFGDIEWGVSQYEINTRRFNEIEVVALVQS
jgi:hypothetical protein